MSNCDGNGEKRAVLGIDKIIADSKVIAVAAWQERLVDAVMGAALTYAKAHHQSVGQCFAAAFDLIVASHYYGNAASKGWLRCGQPSPLLLYPYTNTCPRCALNNDFQFHKANKPPSGNIGSITSTYLYLCYKWFFCHSDHSNFEIRIGKEPVDILILDHQEHICFLAEIKASPLVIFPLAIPSDCLGENTVGGEKLTDSHMAVTLAKTFGIDLFMLLPSGESTPILFKLGRRNDDKHRHWAAEAISSICHDKAFFSLFYQAWSDAFGKYSGQIIRSGSYWLTNSCGSPTPKPKSWPRRPSGGGYETISDNKTSVGMDRTDDIKKGTYQVLKIGSVAKFHKQTNWRITIGLVSNIHAVQHFDEYLASISDVMWIRTKHCDATQASDLPADTPITNLFDGIISFTSSTVRDSWLKNIFAFENAK